MIYRSLYKKLQENIEAFLSVTLILDIRFATSAVMVSNILQCLESPSLTSFLLGYQIIIRIETSIIQCLYRSQLMTFLLR